MQKCCCQWEIPRNGMVQLRIFFHELCINIILWYIFRYTSVKSTIYQFHLMAKVFPTNIFFALLNGNLTNMVGNLGCMPTNGLPGIKVKLKIGSWISQKMNIFSNLCQIFNDVSKIMKYVVYAGKNCSKPCSTLTHLYIMEFNFQSWKL